jgi:hypothetical protein
MLRRAIWMLLGIGVVGSLYSQNLTRSPYSGFGVGDLQFYGFAQQQAMGRITQSYRNTQDYSISNPASYSALKYTVYQVGLTGSSGTLQNTTTQQKAQTISLGYFSLGIPVDYKRGWGAAFGLVPYSAVGFSSYSRTIDATTGNYINQQEGSGGINRFYMGMGKTLHRSLSVGFNASYLFGQLVSTEKVYFHPDSSYLDYREDRTRVVGGFNFDFSAQYHDTIYRGRTNNDNKWILNAGVTYHMGSNLNTRQTLYARTIYQASGIDYRRDTILYSESQKGKLTIPQGYSIGFGFNKTGRKNLWFFGVEYFTQNWKDFSSFGQNAGLANLQSISVGSSYQRLLPDNADNVWKQYFECMQYKAGFRYANTQIVHQNTQIKEYGINFGLGLPIKAFKKATSYINIGVEYNSRGVVKNDLIKENYYRFVFGLTMTDIWFKKYKYE